MAGNMRDLAAFCYGLPAKIKVATNERKKTVVLDIENNLTQMTPIDTGAAISNWQVTVGAPASEPIDPYVPSTAGAYDHHGIGDGHGGAANAAAAMDVARANIAGVTQGETIYIANVVDHIGFLNEDGRSPQAQPGFVERAIMLGRDTADRAKLTL
jgi:hypothetical protein